MLAKYYIMNIKKAIKIVALYTTCEDSPLRLNPIEHQQKLIVTVGAGNPIFSKDSLMTKLVCSTLSGNTMKLSCTVTNLIQASISRGAIT